MKKKFFSIVLLGAMLVGFVACENDEPEVDNQGTEQTDGTNKHNGHEYVDLGLPSGLFWATCNVGAKEPEDHGNYYAWGETTIKSNYSESTHTYKDSPIKLPLSADAANANWGGNWRMPTKKEINELLNNCTWIWINENERIGFEIRANNGNSIFLPAAGYFVGSSLYELGEDGAYWSSSWPYKLNFGIDGSDSFFGLDGVEDLENGLPIRPVYSTIPYAQEFAIKLSVNSKMMGSVTGGGIYSSGSTAILTATANIGCEFVKWSDGNTDNPRKITVNSDISLTANFSLKNVISGVENGHDYVDLGLPSGTLWATCNVGATSPEDYGDYFAWGETSTKSTYDWSTYKYGNEYDQLTKYCNDSDYGYNGFTDNKTTLDLSDDAAHVNWGGDWRMPTLTEEKELLNTDNCTWEWTYNYNGTGVAGRIILSLLNGNSIFLPAAGYRLNSSLYSAGWDGNYWISELDTYYPNLACYLNFISVSADSSDIGNRFYGRSVRAVCSAE